MGFHFSFGTGGRAGERDYRPPRSGAYTDNNIVAVSIVSGTDIREQGDTGASRVISIIRQNCAYWKKKNLIGVLLVTLLGALLMVAYASAAAQLTLTEIYAHLKTKQFVDLTHSFEPGIPHWPGFPDKVKETLYWYEEGVGTLGAGFYAQKFYHVGQ